MEAVTIIERLQILRNRMRELGIDYYLIPSSDYHNSEYVHDFFKVREYYSGFTGSNGTLIVSQDSAGLWTDGRYFIQAEKELAGTGITLFRMMEEGVPDTKEYLLQSMKEGETLSFDGRCVGMKFGMELAKELEEKKVKVSCGQDVAGKLWPNRGSLPSNPLFCLPPELCGVSAEDKISQVRAQMKAAGAQALFLSKLDDLMWLLNVRGSDVECNPVALSYGFLTSDEMYLFVQKAAVTPEVSVYLSGCHITLSDYEGVTEFLRDFSYEGKVLLDDRNMSYLLYQVIRERTDVVLKENPTERLKAVKNSTELARMREVYRRDSAQVIKFICWIKQHAGKIKIDEVSAAEHLDGLRRQTEGFLDLSFPTICGYQENAAMMHYSAEQESCKEIGAEGMLLVDSGGQYLGGTTDVTRTIVLGRISDEMKRHYTKTAAGMLRLSDAVFMQGCTGRNLDILARAPLWELGIDYKCGTGHGIGYILNVHEGPQGIRWKYIEGAKEEVLLPGMILSNEPGVYRQGSHGIRIENVMVVTAGEKNEDGQFLQFETLTFVPIDKDGLDLTCMSDEEISRVNRYHERVYEETNEYLDEAECRWLREVTSPICQI